MDTMEKALFRLQNSGPAIGTALLLGAFRLTDDNQIQFFDAELSRLLTLEEFEIRFSAAIRDQRGTEFAHRTDPAGYYKTLDNRYRGSRKWVVERKRQKDFNAGIVYNKVEEVTAMSKDDPLAEPLLDSSGKVVIRKSTGKPILMEEFVSDPDPDDIDDKLEPDDLLIMLEAGARVGVDIQVSELIEAGFKKDENGVWRLPIN